MSHPLRRWLWTVLSLQVGLLLCSAAIIPVTFATFDQCMEDMDNEDYCNNQNALPDDLSKPLLFPKTNLRLMQPIDPAVTSLPPQNDIQLFYTYFNMVWPWILGIAGGIAVLQALIGGIQIMLSGSDSGKREGGKSRLMWALAGMLMIGLAGVILESLNPTFYVQQ